MGEAKKYNHIFFDLDRTLWDFDHNTKIALNNIYNRYKLKNTFSDFDSFRKTFHTYNAFLWEEFRCGRITKEILRRTRFNLVLKEVGMDNAKLAESLDKEYIQQTPESTELIPFAIEILDYLKKKKYHLYILTNGFKETQFRKIKNSGIDNYFEKVFTSDELFSTKPSHEIFHAAITAVNAKKTESLMIGDDLKVDIIGARQYGIDQVFFNYKGIEHHEKVTYEIKSLVEIKKIL